MVHFGPSKNIESYVQECGHAGRDGEPSSCCLVYNGLLLGCCDKEMKVYVQTKECRRKILMDNFGYQCENKVSYLTNVVIFVLKTARAKKNALYGIYVKRMKLILPCQMMLQKHVFKGQFHKDKKNCCTLN